MDILKDRITQRTNNNKSRSLYLAAYVLVEEAERRRMSVRRMKFRLAKIY